MQLEIGVIVEGKVSKITDFGAFIELENGGSGMVHISEIDNSYVQKVKDFLSEGQTVKVRVIGEMKNGNPSLSIKQVGDKKKEFSEVRDQRLSAKSHRKNFSNFPRCVSFEDMMSKFKKTSEEKVSEYRRASSMKSLKGKRGKRR